MAKTFILARQIQLLAWVTSHSKSTYVQGIDKDFPINVLLMPKIFKIRRFLIIGIQKSCRENDSFFDKEKNNQRTVVFF